MIANKGTNRSAWGFAVALAVLGGGCAGRAAPQQPATPEPAATIKTEQLAAHKAEAPTPIAIPELAHCYFDELTDEQPRCPEEVLADAAIVWLEKPLIVSDGWGEEEVEYSGDEVTLEAELDPAFRQLMAEADAGPTDGTLDHKEVCALEARVAQLVQQRYAE